MNRCRCTPPLPPPLPLPLYSPTSTVSTSSCILTCTPSYCLEYTCTDQVKFNQTLSALDCRFARASAASHAFHYRRSAAISIEVTEQCHVANAIARDVCDAYAETVGARGWRNNRAAIASCE